MAPESTHYSILSANEPIMVVKEDPVARLGPVSTYGELNSGEQEVICVIPTVVYGDAGNRKQYDGAHNSQPALCMLTVLVYTTTPDSLPGRSWAAYPTRSVRCIKLPHVNISKVRAKSNFYNEYTDMVRSGQFRLIFNDTLIDEQEHSVFAKSIKDHYKTAIEKFAFDAWQLIFPRAQGVTNNYFICMVPSDVEWIVDLGHLERTNNAVVHAGPDNFSDIVVGGMCKLTSPVAQADNFRTGQFEWQDFVEIDVCKISGQAAKGLLGGRVGFPDVQKSVRVWPVWSESGYDTIQDGTEYIMVVRQTSAGPLWVLMDMRIAQVLYTGVKDAGPCPTA